MLNTNPSLCICIVFYKCEMSHSKTWISLLKALKSSNSKPALFLQNNSAPSHNSKIIELTPQEESLFYEVKICEDPSNPGVSLAYNRAAQFANTFGAQWLILFDQDSQLPENFFSEFYKSLQTFPNEFLFAPPLVSNNAWVSPCEYEYFKGRPLKSKLKPGLLSLKKLSLLNSGLCISLELFNKTGGYKESVPLDFSDFIFIDSCRPFIKTFVLLDTEIQHSLSASEASGPSSLGTRFGWYTKGILGSSLVFPWRAPIYLYHSLARFFLLLCKTGFSFVSLRSFLNTLYNRPRKN